ncbi:MAG: 50S ribosomal protein L11 methyltransferase [Proteobacteria bacterium]|nr:50S ribosomal protein L11 methyltransferase [Pseudomonadota bacterium]
MPFLQLTLSCSLAAQPRCEHALEDVGALAVTLQDAHRDAADEQAIFEPGVGQVPLWDEMTLTALFPAEADPVLLLAALEAFDPDLDWSGAEFMPLPDQDWVRAWMDDYPPLRFGRSLWIVPWNAELPAEASAMGAAATIIRLDPGLAFGSGTHPTTALCLEWLDQLAQDGSLQGRRVLDLGCGSGILAIAALALGAAQADGIDNDPQALIASIDNAQRNGVAERLAVFMPHDAPDTGYDVVLANILASALDELAPVIAARVRPGGRLALSGILDGQQDDLLARYHEWFDELQVCRQGDWLRITGLRR